MEQFSVVVCERRQNLQSLKRLRAAALRLSTASTIALNSRWWSAGRKP